MDMVACNIMSSLHCEKTLPEFPPEFNASSLAIDLTYSGSLFYGHTKAIEAIKWLETLRKITLSIFKVAWMLMMWPLPFIYKQITFPGFVFWIHIQSPSRRLRCSVLISLCKPVAVFVIKDDRRSCVIWSSLVVAFGICNNDLSVRLGMY